MQSQQEVSGWAVGWTAFAGIYLIIVGFFQAFAGLVGILDDEFYVVTREYIVQFDSSSGKTDDSAYLQLPAKAPLDQAELRRVKY